MTQILIGFLRFLLQVSQSWIFLLLLKRWPSNPLIKSPISAMISCFRFPPKEFLSKMTGLTQSIFWVIFTSNDCDSARFLWKTIPTAIKESKPEVVAAWRIGPAPLLAISLIRLYQLFHFFASTTDFFSPSVASNDRDDLNTVCATSLVVYQSGKLLTLSLILSNTSNLSMDIIV